MTTHLFVTLTVTDPEKMAAYREVAGPALAKYGGAPVQVSSTSEWLDGNGPAPDVAVVLGFPDRGAAKAWRDDPELADVHQLRNDAGNCRILML